MTDGAIGMSDGTVVNIVADLAARLDETVQDIIRALASCGVLNADETGVRICGKLAWMQIISSEKSSLYGRNPTRGTPNDEMNGLQSITYYTEERRLLARLAEYIDEHLRFISDFSVPFSNNAAERGARHIKGKKKVSGGFRSDSGTDNYATIASVAATLRKHGKSTFLAFRDAFRGRAPRFGVGVNPDPG